MSLDISALRENYTKGALEKVDLNSDPLKQFTSWLDVAVKEGLLEPNAMTLTTVNEEKLPRSRTVLLKGLDHGFCLFSNYNSFKAQEIEQTSVAALSFLWRELERQVNITGTIEKMSREESESYFLSRPYESQIGAWVSHHQSAVIEDRAELEARKIQLEALYPEGKVPLPEFWGGYRIIPTQIEFWQGRSGRLHDRFLYQKSGEEWSIDRLSP